MIKMIHRKEEHRSSKYKNLGTVHRDKKKETLPYVYFRPGHEVPIPDPQMFTGRLVDPPPGAARTSQYRDFAQFLQDLPSGPISVLITRPQDEIFIYLYHKSKWGGGPTVSKKRKDDAAAEGESIGQKGQGGQQYAIIVWDRDAKEPVDYGFHMVTTDGVSKRLVRQVHEIKGGNTNMKIQEFVYNLGGGAPTRDRPIWVYNLSVTDEARKKRLSRSDDLLAKDFLTFFASKVIAMTKRMKPEKLEELKDRVHTGRYLISGWKDVVSPEIKKLAEVFDISDSQAAGWLSTEFEKFREAIFKEGHGAYSKESPYNLERDNARHAGLSDIDRVQARSPYSIGFFPDEEDTRTPYKKSRHKDRPDLYQRSLPVALKEYASISSLIKEHTLDGLVTRFLGYLLTGKILAPQASVMGLLGIFGDEEGGLL